MKRTTVKSAKHGRNKLRFAGSRGWIAMGTLAAYAVMGGTKSALAYVEKTAGAGGESTSEASLPLKRFNIAAGPLDEAIRQFEKATGLTVKIVLPSGTLAGFVTTGVVGLYPEEEAMRLLLDGTGLNYRAEDATTLVVGVQAKDSVSVTTSDTNSISLDRKSVV